MLAMYTRNTFKKNVFFFFFFFFFFLFRSRQKKKNKKCCDRRVAAVAGDCSRELERLVVDLRPTSILD